MKRRDFNKLLLAAVGGALAGAATPVLAGEDGETKGDKGKHECRGQNACKGLGGCRTDNNECAGKNDCKGKGGCATGDYKDKPKDKPKK